MTMRCDDVERIADRLAAGRVTDAERTAIDRHAAGCDACRELVLLAEPDAAPDVELTAAVLARTGRTPCETARARLCERIDGPLDALDAKLVDGHRAACAECDALARVLVTLRDELPSLAGIDPGRGFTDAVLARTSAVRRRPIAERFADWLADPGRLWQRPRLALEMAYVATMLIALLVITPGSPLAELPESAWRIARARPTVELRPGAERLWNDTAAPLGRATREMASGTLDGSRAVSERILRHAGTFAERFASNTTGQDDTTGRTPETTETDDE